MLKRNVIMIADNKNHGDVDYGSLHHPVFLYF